MHVVALEVPNSIEGNGYYTNMKRISHFLRRVSSDNFNWNNLCHFKRHPFVFTLTVGASFMQLPSTSPKSSWNGICRWDDRQQQIPLAGCWSLVTVDHTASTCAGVLIHYERNRHLLACAQSVPAIPAGNVLIRIPNWNRIHPNVAFLFFLLLLLLLQGFIITIFIIAIIICSKVLNLNDAALEWPAFSSVYYFFICNGETAPLWFDRASTMHLNIITRVPGYSCCIGTTNTGSWL